jgi:hypothetical protein
LNKRHSTIAFTHVPDDLFPVIRKGLSDQFDRSPVTRASSALESWHFDVIDEPIGDQLVNELETPAGPYLNGDSAQQRLGFLCLISHCHPFDERRACTIIPDGFRLRPCPAKLGTAPDKM